MPWMRPTLPAAQAAPDWGHARQQLSYAIPLARHLAPRTAEPAALALHAAVSAVADLLRVDVAAALVLELPSEAAGDND